MIADGARILQEDIMDLYVPPSACHRCVERLPRQASDVAVVTIGNTESSSQTAKRLSWNGSR